MPGVYPNDGIGGFIRIHHAFAGKVVNSAFDPILALVVVPIDISLYAGKFFQQSDHFLCIP